MCLQFLYSFLLPSNFTENLSPNILSKYSDLDNNRVYTLSLRVWLPYPTLPFEDEKNLELGRFRWTPAQTVQSLLEQSVTRTAETQLYYNFPVEEEGSTCLFIHQSLAVHQIPIQQLHEATVLVTQKDKTHSFQGSILHYFCAMDLFDIQDAYAHFLSIMFLKIQNKTQKVTKEANYIEIPLSKHFERQIYDTVMSFI